MPDTRPDPRPSPPAQSGLPIRYPNPSTQQVTEAAPRVPEDSPTVLARPSAPVDAAAYDGPHAAASDAPYAVPHAAPDATPPWAAPLNAASYPGAATGGGWNAPVAGPSGHNGPADVVGSAGLGSPPAATPGWDGTNGGWDGTNGPAAPAGPDGGSAGPGGGSAGPGGPGATSGAAAGFRWGPRTIVGAAILAVVVAFGAGTLTGKIAFGSDSGTTQAAAPAAPAGQTGRFPGGGAQGGAGGLGFGRGATGLHGESVVPDGNGGYVTQRTQTGKVTAITATSMTVVSDDNFSATYVLGPNTTVDGGSGTIADLAVGHTVDIRAQVAGTTVTATTVNDQNLTGQSGGLPGGLPGGGQGFGQGPAGQLPQPGGTNGSTGATGTTT
jgi:hypothetical protein